MPGLDQVLMKYREKAFSERDKGDRFERLMKRFLQTYQTYEGMFSDVWMWNEFPCRNDISGKDTGIDLVAKTVNGNYWAIQCKCWAEDAAIDKASVDSFLGTSSRSFVREDTGEAVHFAQRLWISTTDKWNSTAEEQILNQTPPVSRLNLSDLRKAQIDWIALDEGKSGKEAVLRKFDPRPHQQDAMKAAHEYYKTRNRGKMIMACGTGKTFTSLRLVEQETGNKGLILYLVPSIALLNQTLNEWAAQSREPLYPVCVCSDHTASRKNGKYDDTAEDLSVDLAMPATTDPDKVASALLDAYANRDKHGLTVVFSTYQSIDVIHQVQEKLVNFAKKIDAAAYTFDFIVCDEAHRTTGVTLESEEESAFVRVHDDSFIHAKKRLYMTATPRLYRESDKTKAKEKSALLCSMDDPELYGEEFYRLGFGKAVDEHLLSDYKVLILTVSDEQIPPELQNAISKDSEINTDDASKLIGCINALSKRMVADSANLAEVDPQLMHTAVAFCQNIKSSKKIARLFNDCKEAYYDSLTSKQRKALVNVNAEHVDGTMGAAQRAEKLDWLRTTPMDGNECRILTNARCLSEGVDVPSLDAVMFMAGRSSEVDIVQSVGRVMRRSEGKKYGYIIIPVVIPVDMKPEEALNDSRIFGTVWKVLNGIRAHDDRFDPKVENIRFALKKGAKEQGDNQIIATGYDGPGYDADGNPVDNPLSGGSREYVQTTFYFSELQSAIYAKMVDKVGNKRYWEQWAEDISIIAERHKKRIMQLISTDEKHKKDFQEYMNGLHKNINPYITEEEAIEMLAQHLITQPIFQAVFKDFAFADNNSVSVAMSKILDLLDNDGSMEHDRQVLDGFYRQVQVSCQNLNSAEAKQKMILELYDTFFKTALPKTVQKLGIVYTPVPVVDFIIHSVNDALKKEFNRTLSDENVHILDPFTGTGTFIVRLLESGYIKKEDLERKYEQELHANEIVLLAYYIATVNIENAYHDLVGETDEYTPFDGICLTDTFQINENAENEDRIFSEVFPKNSERVVQQKNTPIRVIISNPPYAAWQKNANDNNQRNFYPQLENRVTDTYAAGSTATNKNSLYDSYVKAFRWASDRIDPHNGGVIGFVTNGGWLDGIAFDGFRKCLEKEFSSIYIFDLRGDQRSSGEFSRKEGGKIFGSGSRAKIVITVLIKNPKAANNKAEIYYHDIGDYLSREQKLEEVNRIGSCFSTKFAPIVLKPDVYGDWINKRNNVFSNFIIIGDKKDKGLKEKFFENFYSNGLKTQRDAWCYNFSKDRLEQSIKKTISFYNKEREEYHAGKLKDFTRDDHSISWTRATLTNAKNNHEYSYHKNHFRTSMYRPFCKEFVYFDHDLNEMTYQIPRLFPTADAANLVICVPGLGTKKAFMPLIADKIPDLGLVGSVQCFPLYWHEKVAPDGMSLFDQGKKKGLVRHDGITDFILKRCMENYGPKVMKEDIFYYVYGLLHMESYRKQFASDLKKSLPRIPLVEEPKDFRKISQIGRELADIHLHYEDQEPISGVTVTGEETGNFKVTKIRYAKKGMVEDKSTIIYNESIRISGIPKEAQQYEVNGKTPIGWIMDRYQVTMDKKTGIRNDPNDWCEEHGNPRYILDLLLSVITVSVKTMELIHQLPQIDFTKEQ